MKKLYTLLLVVFLSTQVHSQCWQYVAIGYNHNIAVKSDGTLWSWGDGTFGQLGAGPAVSLSLIPIQVGTDNHWQTVSAGFNHSVAIKTDGALWTWGYNGYGQLGNGATGFDESKNTPIQIGTDTNWLSVSAGRFHTLALKNDHTLWTWGYNSMGQLGDGTNGTGADKNVPVQIGSATDWQYISAGDQFSTAIKTNGTLWTWGYNFYGQLGDGTYGTGSEKNIPTQIGTATDWATVAGGYSHTTARKNNGTIWAWGHNNAGQIGIGNITTQYVPIQVGTATDWKSVINGEFYTMGIKTNGTLWGWGSNDMGQFGNGTTATYNVVPLQIGTDTNWNSVFIRTAVSFAIKTNNTIWAWGRNNNGQLGDNTIINKTSPIQFGCAALGISDSETKTISIYPNPVSDILHILNPNNYVINEILITDITGKIILRKNDVVSEINVENLQQGIYLLTLNTGQNNIQYKFIKNK